VSNSQRLVFYKEQHRFKHNGYATNWNSGGNFEIYLSVCKYRVNGLTNQRHDITRTF